MIFFFSGDIISNSYNSIYVVNLLSNKISWKINIYFICFRNMIFQDMKAFVSSFLNHIVSSNLKLMFFLSLMISNLIVFGI